MSPETAVIGLKYWDSTVGTGASSQLVWADWVNRQTADLAAPSGAEFGPNGSSWSTPGSDSRTSIEFATRPGESGSKARILPDAAET